MYKKCKKPPYAMPPIPFDTIKVGDQHYSIGKSDNIPLTREQLFMLLKGEPKPAQFKKMGEALGLELETNKNLYKSPANMTVRLKRSVIEALVALGEPEPILIKIPTHATRVTNVNGNVTIQDTNTGVTLNANGNPVGAPEETSVLENNSGNKNNVLGGNGNSVLGGNNSGNKNSVLGGNNSGNKNNVLGGNGNSVLGGNGNSVLGGNKKNNSGGGGFWGSILSGGKSSSANSWSWGKKNFSQPSRPSYNFGTGKPNNRSDPETPFTSGPVIRRSQSLNSSSRAVPFSWGFRTPQAAVSNRRPLYTPSMMAPQSRRGFYNNNFSSIWKSPSKNLNFWRKAYKGDYSNRSIQKQKDYMKLELIRMQAAFNKKIQNATLNTKKKEFELQKREYEEKQRAREQAIYQQIRMLKALENIKTKTPENTAAVTKATENATKATVTAVNLNSAIKRILATSNVKEEAVSVANPTSNVKEEAIPVANTTSNVKEEAIPVANTTSNVKEEVIPVANANSDATKKVKEAVKAVREFILSKNTESRKIQEKLIKNLENEIEKAKLKPTNTNTNANATANAINESLINLKSKLENAKAVLSKSNKTRENLKTTAQKNSERKRISKTIQDAIDAVKGLGMSLEANEPNLITNNNNTNQIIVKMNMFNQALTEYPKMVQTLKALVTIWKKYDNSVNLKNINQLPKVEEAVAEAAANNTAPVPEAKPNMPGTATRRGMAFLKGVGLHRGITLNKNVLLRYIKNNSNNKAPLYEYLKSAKTNFKFNRNASLEINEALKNKNINKQKVRKVLNLPNTTPKTNENIKKTILKLLYKVRLGSKDSLNNYRKFINSLDKNFVVQYSGKSKKFSKENSKEILNNFRNDKMLNNNGVFKTKYGLTNDNYKKLLKYLTTENAVVVPVVGKSPPPNDRLVNIVSKFNGKNTKNLYNYLVGKDPQEVKNKIPFLTTINGNKRIAARKAINDFIGFAKVGENAINTKQVEKEYANLQELVNSNSEMNRQKQAIRNRFNQFSTPKNINNLAKAIHKTFPKPPLSFIEGVKRDRLKVLSNARAGKKNLLEKARDKNEYNAKRAKNKAAYEATLAPKLTRAQKKEITNAAHALNASAIRTQPAKKAMAAVLNNIRKRGNKNELPGATSTFTPLTEPVSRNKKWTIEEVEKIKNMTKTRKEWEKYLRNNPGKWNCSYGNMFITLPFLKSAFNNICKEQKKG